MQKTAMERKVVSSTFGLKYWEMCGICFFGSNIRRLLRVLVDQTRLGGDKTWLATVNPEFVMLARSDRTFMDILNECDIRVVDGVGLIWAREVLKRPKGLGRWWRGLTMGVEILLGQGRDGLISGADLMVEFGRVATEKRQKLFLLGGWKNRAEESGRFLAKKFPGLKYDFCGGEPELSNEKVIERINKFGPDYLLVAYGMKKQEEWIRDNLAKLKVGVVVGVGRSFDYYSGALKRAPRWVRMMGLEWLYSLIREPKRWRRQLVLPKFIWMVLTEIA